MIDEHARLWRITDNLNDRVHFVVADDRRNVLTELVDEGSSVSH